MSKTLIIHASARKSGSTTRTLATELAEVISSEIVTRDLADGVPLLSESWIGANFTDPAECDSSHHAALAHSDVLLEELRAADNIVIGLPVYNFGLPAALKAWVDQIARARESFRYTEDGSEGLLGGKRAFIVFASGGVGLDSPVDFATPYLRQMLKFIGIEDVTVIDAGAQMMRTDAADHARARIDALRSDVALAA